MSWPKGAEVIQELIDHGHLEPVPANPDEAAYLIEKARLHLQTSRSLVEVDPEIAYDALYAAARKALTAVLRQQGLRPTREGGHEVVIRAAEAQLVPPPAQFCGRIGVSAAFAALATTKPPKEPCTPKTSTPTYPSHRRSSTPQPTSCHTCPSSHHNAANTGSPTSPEHHRVGTSTLEITACHRHYLNK